MNIFKLNPWRKKTPDEQAIKRLSRNEKEAVLIDLKEGYSEIMGLVRDVRMHMVEQTIRTEKGLDILESLPETLASLPEQSKTQQRIAKALEEHCDLVRQNDSLFTDAFASLNTSNANQDQMIQAIQSQVTESRQSTEQIMGGLQAFRASMNEITKSHEASNLRLQKAASQNRKQLQVAIAACWAMAGVSILTLTGGAYVIFSQPAPTTADTGMMTNTPPAMIAPTEKVTDQQSTLIQTPVMNKPLPESLPDIEPIRLDQISPQKPEMNIERKAHDFEAELKDFVLPDSIADQPETATEPDNRYDAKPVFQLPDPMNLNLKELDWPWNTQEPEAN